MPHLATYIGLVHHTEQTLAASLRTVGLGHAAEPDVFHTCHALAEWSDTHQADLDPIKARYGEQTSGDDIQEPERLHADGVAQVRTGPLGLLRDLQDLYLLATLVQTTWIVIYQAAQALRDHDLIDIAEHSNSETSRQLAWLTTRMKAAAPQALLVAT